MQKQDIRIVFMGTPDFAVPTLDALVTGGYNVVGVITMPDKPAGRGHKVQYSPVKQYALDHNLPLLQPEKLKDESFLEALRAWRADLQIVVAFRMLPEVVWAMPRLGTFNLHAALLPQYRGAAPLNWAVINGDKVTGATTFFLDHQIDTGRIILKQPLEIGAEENVGSLHDRMMEMGKGLVTRTVDLLLEADGDLSRVPTIDQNTLLQDLKASTGIGLTVLATAVLLLPRSSRRLANCISTSRCALCTTWCVASRPIQLLGPLSQDFRLSRCSAPAL